MCPASARGATARSASLEFIYFRRKIMFKKQIATVLAAVLALNMMTACTGSGPKTESATGNTEDAAQAVSTQGTEDPNQVAQVPGTQEDAAGGGRAGDQTEGTPGTETKQAGTGQTQQAGTGQTQQPGAGQTSKPARTRPSKPGRA